MISPRISVKNVMNSLAAVSMSVSGVIVCEFRSLVASLSIVVAVEAVEVEGWVCGCWIVGRDLRVCGCGSVGVGVGVGLGAGMSRLAQALRWGSWVMGGGWDWGRGGLRGGCGFSG